MAKNKIHHKLIISIGFVALALLIFYIIIRTANAKIYCPDGMIDNKMPTSCLDQACSTIEKRYYVKDGKRREFDEYNYLWARYVCRIQPELVY